MGDPLRGPERHARPGRGGLRRSRASRPSRSRPAPGFIEIKTEQLDRPPGAGPCRAPAVAAERLAGASGSPRRRAAASAQRQPRARAPAPARRPAPAASPRRSAGSPASPSASAVGPAARPATRTIPTEGKLGEVAAALEDELGPIAEQRSLTTIGAVVSSDLISQALILIVVGSLGIMAWITYRFRDVKFGVTALISLLHDVIVVVGVVRDPRHVLPRRDRRPVRDRDADRHRLQRPRHDRRLRPRPREQGAPRRRAVRRRSSTTRSCRRSAARS